LAERIGVTNAATELGLSSSQLYGWRQKAQLVKARGQVDQVSSKMAQHESFHQYPVPIPSADAVRR
jgi:transposase-like protein